jgi:hypothetical protein
MTLEQLRAFHPAHREERALDLVHEVQVKQEHGDGPNDRYRLDEWVAKFQDLGFFRVAHHAAIIDGKPTFIYAVEFADVRPTAPIKLFRLCDPDKLNRISWTPDPSLAVSFGPGGHHPGMHPSAHLYVATVPRERILAIFNSEWVVNPAGLQVEDLGAARWRGTDTSAIERVLNLR